MVPKKESTLKQILVTGAAGFIGYHLSKALHQRGDTVTGVDNFNDYYSPELKFQRASLLKNEGVKTIEGDICDEKLIKTLIKDHKITHIAHLAAQAGVRYSLHNPQAYVASNLEGFVNILEACRQNKGVILVYASSSSVYGLNDKIPFSIDDRTDAQASLYGVTKKSNELMAKTYHHLYGTSITGLRYFTVYGPWGRPDMAYYSFTEAINAGKAIKVYNNGDLERDFTYIDDIIAGTIAAIDLGAPYELFNLGNNRPISLNTFIETLENSLGKRANKEYLPMQQGDVYKTFADITHSTKKLGYKPNTPLEEGIPKFVEWYKKYAKMPK